MHYMPTIELKRTFSILNILTTCIIYSYSKTRHFNILPLVYLNPTTQPVDATFPLHKGTININNVCTYQPSPKFLLHFYRRMVLQNRTIKQENWYILFVMFLLWHCVF